MSIFGAYLVKMLFILMYLGACHFGFKSSQLVLNRKQLGENGHHLVHDL